MTTPCGSSAPWRRDDAPCSRSWQTRSCIKGQWPTSRSSSMLPGAARPVSQIVAWVWASPFWSSLVGFAASLALAPPVTGWTCRAGAAATPPIWSSARRSPACLPRAERLAAAARKRRLEEIARLRHAQSALPSRALPAILKPQNGPAAGDRLLHQLAGQGRSQLAVAEALAEESGLGGSQLADPGWARPGIQDHARPAARWISSAPPSPASRSCP